MMRSLSDSLPSWTSSSRWKKDAYLLWQIIQGETFCDWSEADTVRGRHNRWEIITAAIGSRKSTIIRFVHAHYGHIGNEMLHIKGPHGTQWMHTIQWTSSVLQRMIKSVPYQRINLIRLEHYSSSRIWNNRLFTGITTNKSFVSKQ